MRIASPSVALRQQGFTLIEALIAFVILSIGLLGIVSLQALSKTSQHHAVQRTRAVTLADAIVERIRINPAGLAQYNIGLNPLGSDPNAPEPNPDCIASACDPNELAAHDLWAWEQALAGAMVTVGSDNTGGLVEPRGCILFTPADGRTRTGQLNVIIQWRGLQASSDAVQAGEAICGGEDAGEDIYRRQVVTNTFVVDETEF